MLCYSLYRIFISSSSYIFAFNITLEYVFSGIYFLLPGTLTILLHLAENKVQAPCVSLWPVRGRFLKPLHVSEHVGIINEVAFSWILTSLSAGLPHALIGAIGLGLRPDRGRLKRNKMSEHVPSPQGGFGFGPQLAMFEPGLKKLGSIQGLSLKFQLSSQEQNTW